MFTGNEVRLAGVKIWQAQLASTIHSGLVSRAVVRPCNGLFAVHGEYKNGSLTAVIAKYQDEVRAGEAANDINRLATLDSRTN